MNKITNTSVIMRLFVARTSAYAVQKPGGDYSSIKKTLTDALIQMHLEGSITIGIYQLGEDNTCIWGCYDVDIGSKKAVRKMADNEIESCKAQELLKLQAIRSYLKEKHGIDSYIEDSGWKGYHLWIFCQQTPAGALRVFMQRAAKEAGVAVHEIFPKQDEKAWFGNLVKLPLGVHQVSMKKAYFFDPETDSALPQDKALELLASLQPCWIPKVHSAEDSKQEQKGEGDTAKSMLGEMSLPDVLPKLRPCFQKAYNEKWEAEGDAGHQFRLASLRELTAKQTSREAIHDYFKNLSKYDPAETDKGIDSNIKKMVKPFQCKTIQSRCSELTKLIETCQSCPRNPANKNKTPPKPTTKDILQELLVGAEFFHNDSDPYVRLKVDGHKEICAINSQRFKRYLAGGCLINTGEIANKEVLSSLLTALEGRAVYQGENHDLFNRVARKNGALWVDLSNKSWQAVKITPAGWSIEDPPILFRRYQHQKPQVLPAKGGDIKKIMDFVHIKNESEELLFLVYLCSLFIPDIPHVILVLYGAQGSAKSTLFKLIKESVDPSKTDVLSFSKNKPEMVQKLDHNWFCGFDNVSELPDWLSDILCRAVTGEGDSKRVLFTDDEDKIYSYKRCVAVNGINVAGTQPDFLERSIILELKRISMTQRKTERELWASFSKAKPLILGGIFDTISKAMSIQPGIKLTMLPRMADFAEWGYALAEALGSKGQDFLDAYTANIEAQNREAITGTVIGEVVLKFMDDKNEWEGTSGELLGLFEEVAEVMKISTKTEGWPKNGAWLSKKLNILKVNLQEVGIEFSIVKSEKHNVLHLLKGTENTSSTSIPPASTTGDGEKAGGMAGGKEEAGSKIPPVVKEEGVATGGKAGSKNTGVNEVIIIPPAKNNYAEGLAGSTGGIGSKFRTSGKGDTTNKYDSSLYADIEQAGREWEQMNGVSISSINMTEFCLWYCEHKDKSKQPSEIRAVAEKMFKITPEGRKPEGMSYLCKTGSHEDCGGFECACPCHTPEKATADIEQGSSNRIQQSKKHTETHTADHNKPSGIAKSSVVKVKLLKSIPQFTVAYDGDFEGLQNNQVAERVFQWEDGTYVLNRLKPGDEIVLPSAQAKALIQKGAAEKID